jgi:hypothetical protein
MRSSSSAKQGKCRLVAIPPGDANEVWPHAAALVKAAMEKGRLSNYADVEHAVRSGAALLWLAWEGESIKAAAVTEVCEANGEKFCTIVACGGHDRGEWLHLLDGLESHAKAEGCAGMRVYGRRGWGKLLPDYRVTRVLLEKTLA